MGIVVTGGAGFIGHHLVETLARPAADLGKPITVLDNLRRGQVRLLAPWIARGAVRFIEGDVRDPASVAAALRGASVVYHLAAQANVVGSEADPDYAFTTNVVGTETLLRAASAAGVRRVVFASSREVYGQPQTLPVPETAPLVPRNTYGASKAAGEMLGRAAAAASGLEVVALRLANVYGPGDTGRVLPIWLARAVRGEELLIYGGRQVLDLIWVGDVVAAMLCAARIPAADLVGAGVALREPASGGCFAAINVGTGQGTSIHELAERVRAAVRRDVPVRVAPARAVEVERYVADVRGLLQALGLVPEPPLAHLPEMAHTALEDANPAGTGSAPVLTTLAALANSSVERQPRSVAGERTR
jgi:UDP-glucose 4-epimerase